MKITIKQSKAADTRSAVKPITKNELYDSSNQHIDDVRQALAWMSFQLSKASALHDWTKVDEKGIEQFYQDFKAIQEKKAEDFKKLPWYQRHINEERHHLLERVPEDVNLFDVLEQIADIVMAGMARTGKVFGDNISPELLAKAYANTIELLRKSVLVEESK